MRFRPPQSTGALAVLAILVLLVTGLGVALAVRGGDDPESVENVAFLDDGTTELVIQDVEQLVKQVFSIDPKRVRTTRRAAEAALVDEAINEYDRLYKPFLAQARKGGLSLTTTPRAIGVVELTGDDGRLLVLAEQTATSPDGRSTTGEARFELDVVQQGGTWKVSGIELL
ncbi:MULTISPECIES: hypothetical protein [unclassified Nocardioides]|uniref:hypothetical protein n=1 Tax=unclassified Nocardioides TaxID=2615069 RepID=UPI0006F65478|nr:MULTISPECIES: hypothetical protein [unclassified Nocardioides]KQY57213.1 hypothetical protein ASD30_13300 [Nocardioides sp. Root140]KQZ68728.1 hypothetical protein ASD66_15755 [Nocardioides sp. Root151]KRF11857.1 hypothetical protein ASH02_17975 [Nocardioides sp. Soil796]